MDYFLILKNIEKCCNYNKLNYYNNILLKYKII